jgi:hypothetical protein
MYWEEIMTRRGIKWQDSGFDCSHCGGEILKHAHRTIPEKEQYYQCNQCSCRWSVGGEILRVGDQPHCQDTGYQRPYLPTDNRLWWAIGIAVLFLIFLRFGGVALFGAVFSVLRFLIILSLPILIIFAIYWVGQKQGFWRRK